jgi:hypothetical protein
MEITAHRVVRVWRDGTKGYPDATYHTDFDKVKRMEAQEKVNLVALGYSPDVVRVQIETVFINTENTDAFTNNQSNQDAESNQARLSISNT